MTITERDKLITDNYDLVPYLISKYYPQYENDDDVIGCASLGLVYASRHYDPSYKSYFRGYARNYIFYEIDKYLKDNIDYNQHISNLSDYNLIYDYDYDKTILYENISYKLNDILDNKLPEIFAVILRLRFWEMLTFKKIGERLNISPERVRQIEAHALRRLRHPRYSKHLKYW